MSINQAEPFTAAAAAPLDLARAIRAGEIDALVVGADGRERVYPLRGADEAYRVFVEAMGEGAVNVALDGTILYCNRRFAEIVGVRPEETIGRSIFHFVEPHDEGAFRAFMWEGGAAAGARRDFRLQTSDGQTVPVLLTATPFDDADPAHSVCLLVTDLTEHHARLAAEAASRTKDQFFAALSHELRTPLTPILMLISAIEGRDDLPADVREDLHVIRQNLQLETRLIDDLLDLGRVVAGKLRVQPVPARAHELVDQAVRMVRGEAAEKNLTLECCMGAADDHVVADQARVLQALCNLLKNAIKFSAVGATVTVASRNRDGAWVAQIIDRGVGISPEVLPRLFNAFEQGDPELARQYGGLGLGLAISKAVVEVHGGKVTAHSDGPGCGAVFTIELPLASPADARS
jgi:PAS domain S-box-containing protein